MADITTSGPVRDTGTGLYPMTRPAEVTVEAPVGNVSTGAVPSSDEPVTVTAGDPTQSSGAHPTPGPVTVHMWPSTPDEQAAEPAPDEPDETDEPASNDTKAITEAENKIVEPDEAVKKSTQPARRAARTRKGK